MNWSGSYAYAGRQPPAARSGIRKRGAASSVNGRRNNESEFFGWPDYLSHEDNSLWHYGIAGQKWGIRRYQNEDGTLTEEGKKRYNDSEPESKTWKKGDAERLTDEELRRRNQRLQTERQYRDLTTTQSERDNAQLKNEIKKDFLKKALLIPVGAVFAYAGTKLIKNYGVKMTDVFAHFAKKKIASIRAAGMLKNVLKKSNVPHAGQYNPLKDMALKRHPEWNGLDLLKRVGQ